MPGKKNTIRQDNFRVRFEKGTQNQVQRIMILEGKTKFAWGVKSGDTFRFIAERDTELRHV